MIDKMEESEVVGLSRLKESVAPSDLDRTPVTRDSLGYYPFATVLQLRVMQIVCGIIFLILGTVAFIEEKGSLNLGLGIPVGGSLILAAGASIHTTKGFSGYRTSTCMPGSALRFLGPSVKIALPLTILWGTACTLLMVLIMQSIKYLDALRKQRNENLKSYDLLILAILELTIALITLLAVLLVLRIDCKYDPD